MKKNALILLLIFAGYSALAQDTVRLYQPDSSYFYNTWLPIDSIDQTVRWNLSPAGTTFGGVRFYSKDSIKIYGIAVCAMFDIITDYYEDFDRYVYDHSLDSVFEDFCIYKFDTVPTVPTLYGEPMRVQLNVTPVSYYWDMGIIDNKPAIYPTYELYFNNAVTLSDVFYVGETGFCDRSYYDASTEILYDHYRYPLKVYCLGNSNYEIYILYYHPNVGWQTPSYPSRYFLPLIFPILTPENSPDDTTGIINDTTGIIDDSLSISNPSPLDRFVITNPNPASTSVQVASSVGLVSIMATDMNGREVYKTTASGMSHMINVSDWKPGLYIFTIKTPMGEIKKKVLVQ